MVHDDPIAVLERELVSAARRLGAGEETNSLPGARRARHGSRGAVAILLSTAAVIAIVLGAVVALGGHRRPGPTPAPAVPSASARQLVDILGVLRRPQTAADRPAALLSRYTRALSSALVGTPDVALMRYATTTPWGERLYLVPMNPPTAAQIAAFVRRAPAARQPLRNASRRPKTLMVISADGAGGAGDAASIEHGQGIETEGAGRSFAGGSTASRITVVVPDGVASVKFVFPRQPEPGQPGAPVYTRSLTVTAPVRNNIVAIQVDRDVVAATFPMIWYGTAGQVVKRIGDVAAADTVTAVPKPGPETALSRAAEKNPSTPNRVWVTPSVGGPHANFTVHFDVLLNDADYEYQLSGTKCPAITVNGGDGGGANDLRGRTWSDVVDVAAGQTWCPGTYHLSATVMDRGRYGQLKHRASPFGTATFTVKP